MRAKQTPENPNALSEIIGDRHYVFHTRKQTRDVASVRQQIYYEAYQLAPGATWIQEYLMEKYQFSVNQQTIYHAYNKIKDQMNGIVKVKSIKEINGITPPQTGNLQHSMKAWDDLRSGFSLCTTANSQYYIDRGLKIERFNDGTFECKNVMTANYHYADVSLDILQALRDEGWESGMYKLNIQRLESKLSTLEYQMLSPSITPESHARLNRSAEKLLNKISEYKRRIKNFL